MSRMRCVPAGTGRQGDLLEVKEARYAEAEAITAREVGKWRVESHLTDAALAAHRQRIEDEIKADPARFVDQPPPAPRA